MAKEEENEEEVMVNWVCNLVKMNGEFIGEQKCMGIVHFIRSHLRL